MFFFLVYTYIQNYSLKCQITADRPESGKVLLVSHEIAFIGLMKVSNGKMLF